MTVIYGRANDRTGVGFDRACLPADEYDVVQPANLRLTVDHGTDIGRVVHLERNRDGGIDLVAVTDEDWLLDHPDPIYLSVQAHSIAVGDWERAEITLDHVALVSRTAAVGLPPVKILRGDIDTARLRWDVHRELLTRAAVTARSGARVPLVIADPYGTARPASSSAFCMVRHSAPAPVELRHGASAAAVSYRHRVIDLVVVPYNEDTVVEYPPNSGRLVTEQVAPGAFRGQEARLDRVKVNRDHDITRPVGRATKLHTDRADGLVAEVRIAATELGDETLALAADGVLDVSIGMAARLGDQLWTEQRSRRRIMRAFLDHIAFVADSAYAGARVLNVRTRH